MKAKINIFIYLKIYIYGDLIKSVWYRFDTENRKIQWIDLIFFTLDFTSRHFCISFKVRNYCKKCCQFYSSRCFFLCFLSSSVHSKTIFAAQKMKLSIHDFSSKWDQIRLRIWSHLLKKSLMEDFIFRAVKASHFS